ncbi:hypothetical protein BCR33DRAFT_727956 [Rhizoclosmatium globosum]|uniref:Uncharacterized protein n=1 Tax=Rhizoclosmatium globosum TaxID=329046 RepID=A0A1Y2AMW3_9FUNG|nr:hypothetical protein BCR33DRAFT_727956 [Rhizoclosmatium globosum]|eukprot:ORY23640.1 hypothetical protein BCR33DRAFT_727956 [Rhizoclosmatium globosum]
MVQLDFNGDEIWLMHHSYNLYFANPLLMEQPNSYTIKSDILYSVQALYSFKG